MGKRLYNRKKYEREIKIEDLLPIEAEFLKILKNGNAVEIRAAYPQLSEPNLIAVLTKISFGNNALPSLFEALASDGDVNAVEKVNSLLPGADQNGSWYKNNLAKAYGISRKGEQWIDEWNKKLDRANTVKELETLGNGFPVSGFYSLLENNQNLIGQCKKRHFPGFIDNK